MTNKKLRFTSTTTMTKKNAERFFEARERELMSFRERLRTNPDLRGVERFIDGCILSFQEIRETLK